MTFFDELRRRNVLRIGGLYLVGAWLVVQVTSTVLPAFEFPGWVLRAVITVLSIGFVPALVFSWAFELTPEGLKREKDVERAGSTTRQTGKKLDRVIMVLLALALGYFATDKFVLAPQREAVQTNAARQQGRSEAMVESYAEKSIAVLPFVDLSPHKDQEYFSDGISEELLNLLAKVPQLRVISRSSAFSYKGKDVEIPEIAKRLNVAHILEGSVRKAGDKVRVTAQLIEARSDTHLWSQTWDRKLDDIFAVQDEIAAAVVEHLKVTLLADVPKVRKVDPTAYALNLQAREIGRQGSAAGLQQATELHQQALAIGPDYAAARLDLSQIYILQANKGLRPVDEGFRLAREAAAKALTIDPTNALAYVTLGRIATDHEGDLPAAAAYLERALALEPTNPAVIRGAANLAQDLGRIAEAIQLDEYVVARDPVNASGYGSLAYEYSRIGRLDDAIASYRTALSLRPGRIGTQYNISELYLRKGDPKSALAALEQEPDESWRRVGSPMIYHLLGQKSEYETALAELIKHDEKEMSYNIAYVFAWCGESDRAFEWLNKAATYRDPGLVEAFDDPMFANIRHDPRWLPFLRKIGRAPEQLAAVVFNVTPPK
jgi:adenylate cyclase